MRRFSCIISSLVAGTVAGGCIPYAVATTANPVTEPTVALIAQAMPAVGAIDSTRGAPWIGVDSEVRFPMNRRADLGLRLVSGTGIVANYKRLVTGNDGPVRIAFMPGIGIVNFGSHGHLEGTLLVSGRGSPFTPYGGVRVMQVVPLHPDSPNDRPTAGGFLGLTIGNERMAVNPEVGVFYDHSTLGVRDSDIVVVPSLSLHGDELIQGLLGVFGVFGRGRRY